MVDLTKYDDDQLNQLRVEVLTEQERRANLSQIPETIAELAAKYADGGGDRTTLEQAIKPTD